MGGSPFGRAPWAEDATKERHLSYDYTERLTFFVLTVEAAFCGYALELAKDLPPGSHVPDLFLVSGFAFICGVLWRTLYNETLHANAHGTSRTRFANAVNGAILWFYWTYVALTAAFFLGILTAGYVYLCRVEGVRRPATSEIRAAPH